MKSFFTRSIFIFILALSSYGTSRAQQGLLEKKIKLSLNQSTIPDALAYISDQAGCTFSYSSSSLSSDIRINTQHQEISLSGALKEIFGNRLEKLQVQGSSVLIVLKKASGSVSGLVKTSDGQPAKFVSISIKGLTGTTVDKDGRYLLKNIPEGSYKIIASLVGLNSQSKQVQVKANETEEISFTLTESGEQLSEVIVKANKPNKFAEKESENIARLPIKNLENPQVYQVVTQAIMKEQMLTSYAEAFQNVAGISTSNILNTRGTSFFLRGFASPPSMRNGMAAPGWAESIEPVNIERVEILKGPSATLFGNIQSSYGGAVNNVTKKPFAGTAGEVGYSLGSWNLSRLTVDYNTPLNKDTTLLFRINAARHWSDTFQDYGFQHSYAVAPSLLYKPNSRLTLALEVEMNNYKGTMWAWTGFGEDVTIKNIKDLKTPYNRSVTGDQLLQEWISSSVYAKADYKLSHQWTSSTNLIQSIYHRSEFYGMNNNLWKNDSTLVREIFGNSPATVSTYQIQQNFNGDFKLGKMRNRMVFGIDVFMTKDNRTFKTGPDPQHSRYTDEVIMNDPSSAVNVSKEKVLAFFAPYPMDNNVARLNTYSIYASDVINITDKLLAMLSLRVDRFDNKKRVVNGVPEATGDYKQTALSPKFGVVYQLVKDQVSIFGNYMNGFTNNQPQQNAQNEMVTYKPSQANQWEGGVKTDLFQHKLSLHLSYYNISVKDALRWTVSPPAQDGTQYSRGFETEVIANPLPGLNISAGYGYNKSKYVKAEETLEGKSLGAPKNVANFWISYKLPEGKAEGLGFGFGGNYVSDVFIINPIVIPSYTLLNAAVFYDVSKYKIGLKVNNLTSQKYWSWDHVTGQPPRNFVLNLAYKF
ncbi:TonB-dependent siderophore receptor [Pedobacter sp. KBW06]|uniref:TonB-dependent receptor n=1 Tax=Pedobacter sp. KBW06 TaxID=2153359 RepID=UPI000F5A2E31|nr:TonB-dependent receptor [Pedobacter sp. KBW06]RQO71866.1 TonB-dependent siderophore receptor [Pedobacter sp. KBW06]